MQVSKYKMEENESFMHKFAKQLIFKGIKSMEIRSFYDDQGNSIKINGNMFKMEYPFLNPEIVRDCYNCKNVSCFNKKCYFIPDTKVFCISDIAILTKTSSLSQIVEIVNKNTLSERKLSFYQERNIPLIIIYARDVLNLSHLYPNLRVHKIINKK